MDITSIVGTISGILSLITLIYLIAIWKGKVDNQLGSISQSMQKYPPEETSLMAKTLWDIYVVDALRNRSDLAERGSSFKLKKEVEELIPDQIKSLLDCISRNPHNREEVATGYLVVKHIGLDLIGNMAREKDLTLQESIAILSCYLEVHCDNVHPTA